MERKDRVRRTGSRTLGAWGLVALLVAGGGASAEEAGTLGSYVDFGANAAYLSAPGVERGGLAVLVIENTPPDTRVTVPSYSVNSEIQGWGGSGRAQLGLAIPDGLRPGFLPGLRAELGGSYLRLQDHATRSSQLPGTNFLAGPSGSFSFVGPVAIDGGPINQPGQFIALGAPRLDSEFDALVQLWDLRLQLAAALDLLDSVETVARLGLMGGVYDQNYDVEERAFNRVITPGSTAEFDLRSDLEEEVDSWFLGPVLGLELAATPVENVRFALEAEVALLYHQSELEARQVLFTRFTQGGGPNRRAFINESDHEDHFNARPRLEGRVELDFKYFLLSFTGAFTYWTYAPEVVNPRVRPVLGNLADLNFGAGSARLSSGDMFAGEVGARLTIPFGRF